MANSPEFQFPRISIEEAGKAADAFFAIKSDSRSDVGRPVDDELNPEKKILMMRLEGLSSDEIRRRVGNFDTNKTHFDHRPEPSVSDVGNGMRRVVYDDGKVVVSRLPWL